MRKRDKKISFEEVEPIDNNCDMYGMCNRTKWIPRSTQAEMTYGAQTPERKECIRI